MIEQANGGFARCNLEKRVSIIFFFLKHDTESLTISGESDLPSVECVEELASSLWTSCTAGRDHRICAWVLPVLSRFEENQCRLLKRMSITVLH